MYNCRCSRNTWYHINFRRQTAHVSSISKIVQQQTATSSALHSVWVSRATALHTILAPANMYVGIGNFLAWAKSSDSRFDPGLCTIVTTWIPQQLRQNYYDWQKDIEKHIFRRCSFNSPIFCTKKIHVFIFSHSLVYTSISRRAKSFRIKWIVELASFSRLGFPTSQRVNRNLSVRRTIVSVHLFTRKDPGECE